jgi:hypothetical protein
MRLNKPIVDTNKCVKNVRNKFFFKTKPIWTYLLQISHINTGHISSYKTTALQQAYASHFKKVSAILERSFETT